MPRPWGFVQKDDISALFGTNEWLIKADAGSSQDFFAAPTGLSVSESYYSARSGLPHSFGFST